MRLHEEAAAGLKRLRPLSVVQLASYLAGANALAALGQHFNQFAADAITDCIGAQVTQSVPLLASMSGGGLDPGSIAIQMATALLGSILLAILGRAFPTLRRIASSMRKGSG